MERWAVVCAAGLAAWGLTGCPEKSVGEASNPAAQTTKADSALETELTELLKEQVAYALKDPSSAQFRNLRLYQLTVIMDSGKRTTGGRRVLCGEVNAKNAFGGYVGSRPFVAWFVVSSETGHVREDSRYTEIADPTNAESVKFFEETSKEACRNREMRLSDIKGPQR